MLDRTYNIVKPAEDVLNYVGANKSGYQALRRRAIIFKYNGKWVLQSCVVEGISIIQGEVRKERSREYPEAVLFEDWLTFDELYEFIGKALQGSFSLGEYLLEAPNASRQWNKERQPLSNNYMPYAGYVWTSRFHDQNFSTPSVLLAPQQPYYPDLHEAVKDWLPFTIYHGQSDGRKGEINLLLPETRAYFEDAIPNCDFVDLFIAGAEINRLMLEVKGAWWDEEGIHHFSEQVSDGHVRLNIPENVKRLDYILVDAVGSVFDYQQEDGYRHTGLGRNRKTDKARTVANIVREACKNGEGLKIEFKPFIYPENNKLKEIFKAVVAFANSQGGQIFIGINDEGELEGINTALGKWAEAVPDEVACDRYLGIIRTKIRDELRSDVQLEFSQTIVDGQRIVIIDVAESNDKPVTFKQEQTTLYLRRGSNNSKTSPEEWKAIIGSSQNSIGVQTLGRY
ncbi:MAG: Uncharacterized protein AWT59_2252 [Candidatus Gallionella acididurans]|uniref:Schlafen AlbA-2 domain-containing protein n=1 Tax=Candidatus Gallionella acididurans TaxID=1796491 RepID=A0A139BRS1_9PROT|nr:MAG: Uncharacterized protein AWT59_2252 [Candidatus Gallionella acididurans]